MGTRSDYYVGRGVDAEWLGAKTHDGHPEDLPAAIWAATTEEEYRAAVAALFVTERDDCTLAAEGWPWPWADSQTTDYAYAFADGVVCVAKFGRGWVTREELVAYETAYAVWSKDQTDTVPEPPEPWGKHKVDFPNMKDRTNKDLIFARSGLIFVGGKP